MSFFQLLTNAYVPFNQKYIRNNLHASLANSAYNACHILVGKALDSSTSFKRKAALEIMLFLITIGLIKRVDLLVKNDDELDIEIIAISMSLALSLHAELNDYFNQSDFPPEYFIEEKIRGYIEIIRDADTSAQLLMIVMFLEYPLLPFGHVQKMLASSKIGKDLGLILIIQPMIMNAVKEMRASVKKMYGIN